MKSAVKKKKKALLWASWIYIWQLFLKSNGNHRRSNPLSVYCHWSFCWQGRSKTNSINTSVGFWPKAQNLNGITLKMFLKIEQGVYPQQEHSSLPTGWPGHHHNFNYHCNQGKESKRGFKCIYSWQRLINMFKTHIACSYMKYKLV